jgi:phosphate-selective porin OprO/OprP
MSIKSLGLNGLASLLAMMIGMTGSPLGAGEEKEKEEEEKKPPASVGKDRFVIESADGDFRLRLGGVLQFDGRFYLSSGEGVDTLLLRRVRPIFQGTVGRRFDFYLMPDFGEGKTVLQDAYLDVHCAKGVALQIGKFKSPVALERLLLDVDIVFVERAFPTDLAPNRDLGLQLHGELGEGLLSYAFGVFNGVPDGAIGDVDTNSSKDVEGRVFLKPFRRTSNPLQGLGLGIAGTRGREDGALPSFRTPGQLLYFSYASSALASGLRTRILPQASFYGGPLGLLGEYARTSQWVRKGTETERFSNEAWEATATLLLTGEKASPTGIRPRHPFAPEEGQWGAFELALRISRLDVDPGIFAHGFADSQTSARQARSWGVGMSWYLNRNLRFVVDFVRTTFQGGGRSGDREPEDALLFRSQVAF